MEKFGSQPDNDNFNDERWSAPKNNADNTGKHFADKQPTSSTEQTEDNVDQAGADTYDYSRYSRNSENYNAKEKAKVPLGKKLLIGAAAIALAGGMIYGVSKNNIPTETPEPTEQEQTDTSLDNTTNSNDSNTDADDSTVEDNDANDSTDVEFGQNAVEDTLTVDELARYIGYDSLSEAVQSDPDEVGRRMCNWMSYNGYTISSHGYTIINNKKTGSIMPETDPSIFDLSDGSQAAMSVRALYKDSEFSILIYNDSIAISYNTTEIPSTVQAEQILLEQGQAY